MKTRITVGDLEFTPWKPIDDSVVRSFATCVSLPDVAGIPMVLFADQLGTEAEAKAIANVVRLFQMDADQT